MNSASETSSAWRGWMIAAVLIVLAGLVTHEVTLMIIPKVIMKRALETIAPGRKFNVMRFPKQADETMRVVVMPSPDLLYSVCAYDLHDGPVELSVDLPAGTPWSLTGYDEWTNNFFVDDDRQFGGLHRHYIVGMEAQDERMSALSVDHPHLRKIFSPTPFGLLMIRTVVNIPERLAELDSTRKKASCQLVPSISDNH